MSRLTEQTIRGYQIGERLSSGGFGEVYRAVQESVARDVAIKVILPQYANEPDFIANFEAEARLVAQLEHPHIVPLHDYWQDEQGAFLIMRYVRGGSLRQMLAKQGALALTRTVRVIEQIADALNAAHEAGVVHRDLKPENILIDQRGNAYLSDFGIAKRLSGEDAQSATDAIKGTFAYLSPEQIQQSNVSPQTDIYALGIVLYEMLTGQHPFQDTPIGMMVVKHLQERLPDIREVREDLSGELDDIIQKATAKDPAERYTSTLEVASALRNIDAVTGAQHTAPLQPPTQLSRKTRATPEQRNRFAMLQNVETFWVEGVLEHSVHGAAMIELGMKSETGAVDNPWDTLLRTPAGEEWLPAGTSIADVFERLNGKLLILGDPGSGKTTTLLVLARDLLKRAAADSEHPIPVVFNLASWSEKQPPLTDWLIAELNGKYQVPRKVASKWVEADELLLLLDGLDEVAAGARDACVNAINAYREEHGFVDVVVCSRIRDYEALTRQLKLNGAVVIEPLNDAQIQAYLTALGPEAAIVRTLINRDERLRDLAQSPLMLSIMVLAYREASGSGLPDFDDSQQPDTHIWSRYVDYAFEGRAGGYSADRETALRCLSWIAAQMDRNVQTIFQIENLQPSWLDDGRQQTYRSRFRLFLVLKYSLAWLLIGGLTGEGVRFLYGSLALTLPFAGAFFGYIYATERWKQFQNQFLFGACIGLAVGIADVTGYGLLDAIVTGIASGIAGAFISLLCARLLAAKDTDRMVIDVLDRVRFSREAVRPITALYGFLAGMAVIFAALVSYEPTTGELAFGLSVGGVIIAIEFLLQSGLTAAQVEMRTRANEGIWATLSNANRTALVIGFFWSVAAMLGTIATTGTVFAVSLGALVGSITAHVFWLAHGGYTVLQHVTLRWLLQRDDLVPRNLARFLEEMVYLGLLRKVGGGYIFIHRYLLEYFAGLQTGNE